MERKLNLVRSPHDPRDKKFTATRDTALPLVADLRSLDRTVFDQLDIGSCVYNTYAKLHDFLRKKEMGFKGVFKDSSRLYGYNLGRQMIGSFNEDSGTDLRTGGLIMNKFGTVPESSFTYDHAHLYKLPSDQLIAEGKTHVNPTFYACDTTQAIRECLAQGYPVAIGFDVPTPFMDDQMATTGQMSDHDWRTGDEGGHAVLIVGYDFSDPRNKFFHVKNSWGSNWAIGGCFKMPAWVVDGAATYDAFTLRIR